MSNAKQTLFALSVILLLILAGCGPTPTPAPIEPLTPTQPPVDGQAAFAQNCAGCHGTDGEGNVGPALKNNAFIRGKDEAGLVAFLKGGRPDKGMPAWISLGDESLTAIAKHLRSWNEGATAQPAATPPTSPTPRMEKVTLGMGFIPNVQFAPFYVAVERGYFAEEGIEVEFDYGMESDLLKLVGIDRMQFVVGSGDQVILARAQDLPAVYVMAWYRRFPVVVFSLQDKGITTPKDLEGKTVGIPGLYGASYVAWQALVYATGLDESEVTLESIGYTQGTAVSQGQVDAALDYSVSGPTQLPLAGQPVNVIYVSDYIDLPSNGLITNQKTIAERPELVQGVVRAVLRGLRDTLDDPDAAFDICLEFVPEAGGDNAVTNRAVLAEAINLWRADTLGVSDAAAWQAATQFMKEMGMVDVEVNPEELFTNQFVTEP